jgi:hypothetical protein
MPLLRCTDEECGHQWFVATSLAIGAACDECGGETVVVGVDDDGPEGPTAVELPARSHPGHARAKARQVAQEHGFVRPPVVVHRIARDVGFTVRTSRQLGTLRARLVGSDIEVNAEESGFAQRFSVAHELGHHFLNTQHGGGDIAEKEADAFAGEMLVPGPMLSTAMEQTSDTRALCDLFKVSRTVLEIAAKHHRVSDRLTG